MGKEKTKENYSGDEVKRYLGSLVEHVDSRFDAIGENIEVVVKRVVKQEIAGVERQLNSHTEMIAQIMVDVTEIKNGLKQKVDYSD